MQMLSQAIVIYEARKSQLRNMIASHWNIKAINISVSHSAAIVYFTWELNVFLNGVVNVILQMNTKE
jgi:hypothetical protein